MKEYERIEATIKYSVYCAEGESPEEAVMNSIEGYDGEILDIKIDKVIE